MDLIFKSTGFGESINVTLGLPLIRTSVDHGTAYDLSGKQEANESSFLKAYELASRLTLKSCE